MEQQSFHPLDYLSVAQRRKWWFIGPLVACVALGALTAAVWPRKYLSRATIGMQSPTLSAELIRSGTIMDPAERQRAVQQMLVSPTVLERVIREEKINPSKPASEVVGWLRDNLAKNIEVPLGVGPNNRPDPTRGIDLFYIGYTDKDPVRAQRITNRVASVFVEENSKAMQTRAENSVEVLEAQVQASQARMSELESKLAARKKDYIGTLPEQVGANVQMANGAQNQLDSLSMQIRSQNERLTMIDSQLEQMRQGVGVNAMTQSSIVEAQLAKKHIDDLEAQLAADRALGYGKNHPEISRLEREIKQSRANIGASRSEEPANREVLLKSDPIYLQKLQEREMVKLQIRDLQNAVGIAQRQIGDYRRRVEAAPVAEQELAPLDRELSAEKVRFSELTTRLSNARVAEDVAHKQGGERFSLLYPASLPDEPIEPKPLKIMALALVAGLVLGAVGAVGREFLDRSVHDTRALENEFEVPVLGEIPRIAA